MDTINFNPVQQSPIQTSGGSKTTLYIVVFFLCVISTTVGVFYYMLGSKESENARKLAEAKSEEEKREIQRKAELESQKATLAAKEEMLKKAQARVDAELSEAAKRVREAKELQRKAGDAAADAATKQKEADEAMKKAEETNDANAKKLAEEKKKLADEAAAKVAEAEKKAKEATDKAKAEAKKATDLQKRVDGAEAKLKGKVFEAAAKYGAVPGYIDNGVWKDVPVIRIGLSAQKTNTPKLCARAARREGVLAYGFRTDKHPTKNKRNTCFIYKKGARIKFEGNGDDEAHITGCAFGGNPKTQCHGYPGVTMYDGAFFNGSQRTETGIKDVKYVGNSWNDRISSVKVPKHTILYLFKDANYGGGLTWTAGPANRILTGGWGNNASSFKIQYI